LKVITSPILRHTLKYVILLGIGLLLLWLAFKGQDLKEILHEILHARPLYVMLSVLCGFVAFVLRAYRWNLLIEPLGFQPRLLHASWALAIGYMANIAIPRMGEISRCITLNRTDRIPIDRLFGTVITERIIDVIVLVLSALLVAFLQAGLMDHLLHRHVLNRSDEPGQFLISLLILAVVALLISLWLLFSGTSLSVRLKEKIILMIRGLLDGLLSVLKVRNKLMFIIHTLLIWMLYYFSTYLCFFALDATAHLGWHEGLFILVAGGLAMLVPVQGGIGAYHYIVSQALLLVGIQQQDSLAYATLIHASQMFMFILLGFISLLMLLLRK
jgi:uncharacterized protein (TIRG00374 family)